MTILIVGNFFGLRLLTFLATFWLSGVAFAGHFCNGEQEIRRGGEPAPARSTATNGKAVVFTDVWDEPDLIARPELKTSAAPAATTAADYLWDALGRMADDNPTDLDQFSAALLTHSKAKTIRTIVKMPLRQNLLFNARTAKAVVLLTHQYGVATSDIDVHGRTALHIAIIERREAVARALIRRDMQQLLVPDSDGIRPTAYLMAGAVSHQFMDFVLKKELAAADEAKSASNQVAPWPTPGAVGDWPNADLQLLQRLP